MAFGEGKNRRQTTVGKGALDGGCGLPRARSALAMTWFLQGVRCVEESPSHGFAVTAPFRQGGLGGRIATAGVRTGFAMTPLTRGAVQIRAGGQRRRPLRRVTRGAMGGRPQGSPLRKSYKGCGKTGRCGRRPRRKFFDREEMVCFGFWWRRMTRAPGC